LKSLLAFSSVENIGIILLGVGAGLLFRTYNLGSLASLALVAGLYHCFNYAIFKTLLFLGAGAGVGENHTRNMGEKGGLLKRMPHIGAYFVIGSLALAGFPSFN